MKNLVIIAATALMLAGCVTDGSGTVAEPPQVQVVKVPVVKPWPTPPVINKPDLAINHLAANASQAEKIKATELTNLQLVNYSNKLKSALEVYRNNKLSLKRRSRNKVS